MALQTHHIQAVLKPLYASQRLRALINDSKDRTWLRRIKKTRFEGRHFPIPVQTAVCAGGDTTFSTAQTNAVAPTLLEFQVTPSDYHLPVSVDSKALRRAKTLNASFARARQIEIDSVINRLLDRLAFQFYRTSDGQAGLLSMTVSTSGSKTVTFADAGDMSGLEKGDKIQYLKHHTATNRLLGTGSSTITALQRGAKTATVNVSFHQVIGSSSAYLVNDTVPWSILNSTTGTLAGGGNWISSSAPVSGSDSFFGVSRGGDASRESGTRITGSLSEIRMGLQELVYSIEAAGAGGRPDLILMHPLTMGRLQIELLKKNVQMAPSKDTRMGYSSVFIDINGRSMECMTDRFCQEKVVWALNEETWRLLYAGDAPAYLDSEDGNIYNKVHNASQYELRGLSDCAFACEAPGANGRLDLV